VVWLLAFSKDKRIAEALKGLLREGELVYATSTGNPRSLPPEDLIRLVPEGCLAAACEAAEDALRDALGEAKKRGGWLVVAGSVYLAGAVRDLLGASQTV
jgi:folylpolyglutamate synthase/dihydropteroate synthase